jgi:endonuclease/exonuclease/phosphatase family metal-dependent hydrolase
MKLISSNLAGRLRRIPRQVEMLAGRKPGLVALQEVRRPGLSRLRTLLRDSGLIHQVDRFELAPDPALLAGPHRYGLLIASRFPLRAWEPGRFDVPWRERILLVDIEMPWGLLAMHTTHIPPGVTNGWIKIDHCFASASLRPASCTYLQTSRESGLCDHAALEVVLSPSPYARHRMKL